MNEELPTAETGTELETQELPTAETGTELETQEGRFTLPALIARAAREASIEPWTAWQAFNNRFKGAPEAMVAAALYKAHTYGLDVLEDVDVFQPKPSEPWIVVIKVDGRKKLAKRNPGFRAYTVTEPELRDGEWWVWCEVSFADGREPYRTWGRCKVKGQRKDGSAWDVEWAPEIARARAIRNALRDCFPETAADPAMELAYERWEAARAGLLEPVAAALEATAETQPEDGAVAGSPETEPAPSAAPSPPPGPGAGGSAPEPEAALSGARAPQPADGGQLPLETPPGEADLERRMDLVRRIQELARYAFPFEAGRRRWFRDAFRLLRVEGYEGLDAGQLAHVAELLEELARERGEKTSP